MNRHQEWLRPVWIEISLDALQHNISEIRRIVGSSVEIMAVVKAEGYGHGAIAVAKTAIAAGASSLGVAMPEEGIALRQAGLNTPILIFGPLQTNQATAIVKYDLIAAACNYEAVAALSQEAVRLNKIAQIHVKIDTGMGRVGVQPGETIDFIRKIAYLPGIKVSGIFSHLATADEKDKGYAQKQIDCFTKVTEALKVAGLLPEQIHLANSAGIIDLPAAYFNMVRPGIMLYGLYPSAEVNHDRVHLEPVLSLKAKVTFVKKVTAGTGISYGQKYHTDQETTIATIPIGYADGWSRMLTGKAKALVNGKKFPIVGTICMDQCMIDLGAEPVQIGQEVVLIGKMGASEISADDVAGQLGTINYEVTCMLSNRIPRVYIHEK